MQLSQIARYRDAAFQLPDVPSWLPPERHHDAAAIERHCNDLARAGLVGHFGNEDAAERFLARRLPLRAALCYPRTLDDRAAGLASLAVPTALADEAFRAPGVRDDPERAAVLRDRLLSVLDDVAPPAGFALGRLLYTALSRTTPRMPPAVARRYRQAHRETVECSLHEAAEGHDDTVLDFATYLGVRRTHHAAHRAAVLTEYAIGVDLTRELSESPALAAARDLAVDHLTLVDELFSFPEECRAPRSVSAVWVFVAHEGRTVQGAVDKLAGLVAAAEEDFAETCARVLHGPLGERGDVLLYLRELGHLMSGNLHHHRFVRGGEAACVPSPGPGTAPGVPRPASPA
ncbi:hypothetical protein GQS52_07665 [Streptomyces sp. SCUT-3]|uniref:terpene synthase family protein n=1 Tax=Streptomyces TaxID=1883 RepID=UPI000CA7C7B1|nr:terpene synthase family protein [Streptomyces sp. SCUT-3]PLW66816.1 hypothetical protein C0036_21725 [Streptomyces sp. DJ]QMV21678.1 hypothetical protein GQS52_07665 [Streptomyces sp. SCUT-3]